MKLLLLNCNFFSSQGEKNIERENRRRKKMKNKFYHLENKWQCKLETYNKYFDY